MRSVSRGARSKRRPVSRNRLHFGLARDTGSFDGSFRLVHDQYVWRKYMVAHPSGRRLSLHHALPSTKIFVAKAGSEVVGTLTLVQDSSIGLPMDEVYREELSHLRDRGRRLGEVSALAMDPGYRNAGVGILMRLVRIMLIHVAEVSPLDDLCIAVNPRHADFYLRAFRSSSRLGDLKEYQRVNGAPAVGLHLDLDFIRSQIRAVHMGDPGPGELYTFFFGPGKFQRILTRLQRELPRSTFSPQQFRHFFSTHDALTKATAKERALVQSLYAERRPERFAPALLFSMPDRTAPRQPALAFATL